MDDFNGLMTVIIDGKKVKRTIACLIPNEVGFLEPHPELHAGESIQRMVSGDIYIYKTGG